MSIIIAVAAAALALYYAYQLIQFVGEQPDDAPVADAVTPGRQYSPDGGHALENEPVRRLKP